MKDLAVPSLKEELRGSFSPWETLLEGGGDLFFSQPSLLPLVLAEREGITPESTTHHPKLLWQNRVITLLSIEVKPTL